LEAREGAPGNRTAELNITVGSRNLTADLTYMSPPALVRVAGRIVVSNGAAPRLGNARVRLGNTATLFAVGNDGTFKMALQEGTYAFSVTDLPAGFEIISIASGSVNLLPDPLRIEPRNGPVMPDVIVTLSALPRFKVHGRVVADPPTRPVEGAAVLLTNGAEIWKTTVRADGTFELSDLLAGAYTLSVQPFGFANVNTTIVVANADVNIELKSQPFY
jgi:hypothetical protein